MRDAHDRLARPRHAPWGWIGACAVLAIVAAGLLVWALGLRSELDDQRAATRRAQAQARTAEDRVGEVSGRLDQARRALDDVGRALDAASDDLRGALGGVLGDLVRRLNALRERVAGGVP